MWGSNAVGYLVGHFPIMPRRNSNAVRGGRPHTRSGRAWMKGKRKKDRDRAPLTPGEMHAPKRLR